MRLETPNSPRSTGRSRDPETAGSATDGALASPQPNWYKPPMYEFVQWVGA
jgi:hypothetical protein